MKVVSLLICFVLLFSCAGLCLTLESPAFDDGSYIPSRYTCTSYDYSPPLKWYDIPEGTKSFVVICDDPDAPFKVWVHWVIFNIPKNVNHLEENIPKVGLLSSGAVQGVNDFGKIGYGGPCPPPGKPHRYFFKLYAVDTMLNLRAGATKGEVLKAIKGHVLGEAQLIGLYRR